MVRQVSSYSSSGGSDFNVKPELLKLILSWVGDLKEIYKNNDAEAAAKQLDNIRKLCIPFLSEADNGFLKDKMLAIKRKAFPVRPQGLSDLQFQAFLVDSANESLVLADELWSDVMRLMTPYFNDKGAF